MQVYITQRLTEGCWLPENPRTGRFTMSGGRPVGLWQRCFCSSSHKAADTCLTVGLMLPLSSSPYVTTALLHTVETILAGFMMVYIF